KSWNRHLIWPRRESRDGLITFQEAFQLVPICVVAPAAKAMREVFRIQILNCRFHACLLRSSWRGSNPKVRLKPSYQVSSSAAPRATHSSSVIDDRFLR